MKNKKKNFWCWLGLHKWDKPVLQGGGIWTYYVRSCKHCDETHPDD